MKEHGIKGVWTTLVAFLPIALFALALAVSVVRAITYKGAKLEIDAKTGVPDQPFDVYDTIMEARRQQLICPALLTAAGVLFFVIAFFVVLLPAAASH